MFPESDSASTVADKSQNSDENFLIQKISEFSVFKKEFLTRMNSCKRSTSLVSLMKEFKNDSDTLYTDILSIYGAMVDEG